MGVSFAGKGATDTVAGADTSAAASADLMKPAELDPTGLNPMQTQELKAAQDAHNNWLLDNEQAAAAAGSLETTQTNIGEDGYGISGVKSFDDKSAALKEAYFEQPGFQAQESILQETEGMGPNPFDELTDPEKLNLDERLRNSDQAFLNGQELLLAEDPKQAADIDQRHMRREPGVEYLDEGEATDAAITDEALFGNKLQQETTAEQVSTDANDISAATPDANQSTQTTQTTRQQEQATKVDQKTGQTDQETTEDTRGKGGKKDEDKFWDLHDFSWDNLGKWLETKEGRKFFLEWGAKFTAMSGGAAPNRKKLTKKQAAAIRKKVKEKYGR